MPRFWVLCLLLPNRMSFSFSLGSSSREFARWKVNSLALERKDFFSLPLPLAPEFVRNIRLLGRRPSLHQVTENLIKKYGTHFLLSATLGGKQKRDPSRSGCQVPANSFKTHCVELPESSCVLCFSWPVTARERFSFWCLGEQYSVLTSKFTPAYWCMLVSICPRM